MAGTRYELMVAGCLSERARWAFPGMRVAALRSQTSIYAEFDDGMDLRELLDRCSRMGLRLISVRQLSSITTRTSGATHAGADRTSVQARDPDSSPSGGAAEPSQAQPSAVRDERGGT
jgi:hypothetical protein